MNDVLKMPFEEAQLRAKADNSNAAESNNRTISNTLPTVASVRCPLVAVVRHAILV